MKVEMLYMQEQEHEETIPSLTPIAKQKPKCSKDYSMEPYKDFQIVKKNLLYLYSY